MTENDTKREEWFNDPLRVGVAIYAQIPNDDRSIWAADILDLCCGQVAQVPKPVSHVLALARDHKRWADAHDAFSAVRELTLAAENAPIYDLAHLLLYVAENTAKVVYKASGSPAPFDRDSGAWLVRCAKEFTERVDDVSFTQSVWNSIAGRYVAGE